MTLVNMISLGCPKNLVDSEAMLGVLAAHGYTVTTSLEAAELIIINTCSFIRPAVKEALNTIFYCLEFKKKGACRYLVVTGCFPQRYGPQLAKLIPEVDVWLGVDAAPLLLDSLQKTFAGEKVVRCPSAENRETSVNHPRLLTTPPSTAYLKIAEGCSHFCSYCLIPYLRGPLKSKPLEVIYREACSLAENGVKEIVLVAQDTGSYGRDLTGQPSLQLVLKQVAKIPQLEWVRILYLSPSSLTPELIEIIRNETKICHYLDLPFQHANQKILRKMGRKGNLEEYLRIIDYLRSVIPDLTLRTTLMVGFPGEDEQAFQELLNFIEKAEFERLGVFPYYHEEGTRSFRYPQTVSYFEKRRRCRNILQLQRKISRKKNREQIGKELKVLIERDLGNGVYLARSFREAPEVDPKIILKGKDLLPGVFTRVKITQAYTFDLAGIELLK
ncbi:MAG: 30S ribosomal protein S12 methylthiotransferase RimO [Bacillota bacterium]|nr:30S ribosomal protein S12 methylthiotransferase RimO [Bacillota bacterium]